jgi:PRTRC genetic system protein E
MEKNFLRSFKGYKIFEQQAQDGSNVNFKQITVENTDISFEFDFSEPGAINKAIEAAKSHIKNLPKPADEVKPEDTSAAEEIVEETPVRKCRVCGCTDNDCLQCVAKTGEPCHWVEEDLCSACAPAAEIKVTDTRASQHAEENIEVPSGDSFFFQRLATMGNLDMTLRIMKVDGHLTMMITPGNGVKGMKPLNITGTPEEFDRDFINSIIPQAKNIPGLITNIEQVKQSAAPKEKAKPATTTKAAEKKPTPTRKPKQKAVKKAKTSVKPKLEKMKGKTIKEDKKQKHKVSKPKVTKPAETVKEEATPAVVEQSLF